MPGVFTNHPLMSRLPHFVRAKTASGLQQKMLKEQQRLKAFIHWFDIQWVEKDSRWYAWYVIDVEDSVNE